MIAFSVVSPADLSLAEDFCASVPQSCLSIAAMEGVLPRLCAGRLIPALTSSGSLLLSSHAPHSHVRGTPGVIAAHPLSGP